MCRRKTPGHALSILRGKLCFCSRPRCRLFIKQQYKNSAGQPFSGAEAAFSSTSQVFCGPGFKSMPGPRPGEDTLFYQYVYFGLDPAPPAPLTLFHFISSYSRTVFFFFSSPPAPPEVTFCSGAGSLHSVFQWSGRICIIYFPESSFLGLTSRFYVCPPPPPSPPFFTASFVHLPAASLVLTLYFFQPSTFNKLVPSLPTPHSSTSNDFLHLSIPPPPPLSSIKTLFFFSRASRGVGTLRLNVKSIQLIDATRHYGRMVAALVAVRNIRF